MPLKPFSQSESYKDCTRFNNIQVLLRGFISHSPLLINFVNIPDNLYISRASEAFLILVFNRDDMNSIINSSLIK